jgi:glycosyltransferase involved in cell wall biosynthesis
VVDGASIDGTLNVIRSNHDLITEWISEPDSGIYDAWNKACRLIKGDWVYFMGAGDEFYEPNALELMAEKLVGLSDDVAIAYGNVFQFLDGYVIYKYGKVNLGKWDGYRPKLPAHQGVFHRAKLFINDKPFDDSYKVVADSKFLLTSLVAARSEYFNINLCKMQPGGISSRDDKLIFVKDEWLRLESELNYKIPLLLKSRYLFSVYIRYFFHKFIGVNAVVFLRTLRRRFSGDVPRD